MKVGPRLPAALLFGIGSALVLSIAAGLIGCNQLDQPTPIGDSEVSTPLPTSDALSDVSAGVSDNKIVFGQSAAFTGAAFLREARWDNIVNLRASYYQETEEMVARLIGDLGINRIGVMYQDDSFGRAGYRGVRQALARRGMEPVAVGLYPRNTLSVKTGVLDLHQAVPEAVILIGAYQPVAASISWARHIGMDPVFMTVSFVGSNALADELGAAGEGVFVTQVVPFPTDDSLPIISSYHDALSAYAPDAVPGFVSLEGYLAGRLAIAGLERCGREVDRSCFLDGLLQAESIDIDGFQVQYRGQDNQGSDAVFLTVIGRDGTYYPVDDLGDPVP